MRASDPGRRQPCGVRAGLLAGLLAVLGPARAAPAEAPAAPARLCAYDPSGRQGEAFRAAEQFADAALGQGLRLTVVPHTDEQTALEDFRARRCDWTLLSGLRARQLVPFAGSIEALGGLQDVAQLASLVRRLASPKAATLMRHQGVAAVAVVPAGGVYLYLRDRAWAAGAGLAGRRIAQVGDDPAARTLIDVVGAAAVPADIGNFAAMFNNGSCDACYAPALAYGPLELHRGLGQRGAIVRIPLTQLTFQVLAHADAITPALADWGRAWAAQALPQALERIHQAERQVPASAWLDPGPEAAGRLGAALAAARARVAAQPEVYDPRMLRLLDRVRGAAPARGAAPP